MAGDAAPLDILVGSQTITGPQPLVAFVDLSVLSLEGFALWARVKSGVATDILFETSQDGVAIDNDSTVPKNCGVGAQVSFRSDSPETRKKWAIFASPPDATPTLIEYGVTIVRRTR